MLAVVVAFHGARNGSVTGNRFATVPHHADDARSGPPIGHERTESSARFSRPRSVTCRCPNSLVIRTKGNVSGRPRGVLRSNWARRDGLLLPGNPALGVVRYQNSFNVFVSEEALQAAEEVEAAMMLRVKRPPDSPIGSQIIVQDPSGRQFRARIPRAHTHASESLHGPSIT